MFKRITRGKRIALAGAACTLGLALTGCAGTGAAQPQGDGGATSDAQRTDLTSQLPEDIQERGVIKVASNVEYPPFEYYDTDNTTIIGLDKDIADELSERLGVALEFNNMSFDAIIPALEAKRFDMAMSAMTDNEERRQKVDFVDYFQSGGGFLTEAGNPHGIESLDDICGLTVAVDKGTTNVADAETQSETCQESGQSPVDVQVFPGTSKIVLALETGRADVAMLDTSAGAYIAQENEGKFEVPGAPYAPRPYGIVFPKGSDQLATAVQAALQSMLADGAYEEILAKWGQDSGAIEEITINEGHGLG